jgi:hypothetical protein
MLGRWKHSGGDEMSTSEEREPTEEELRAAYETQIKQIRVEHVLLENVVTLANLGMRRTGLAPGTEDERDTDQVRLAIESIRAQLPLVEQVSPQQAGPIRDALSQLQLAFVRIGGEQQTAAGGEQETPAGGEQAGPAGGEQSTPPPPPEAGDTPSTDKPDEAGPAQRSGRLWVPGQ